MILMQVSTRKSQKKCEKRRKKGDFFLYGEDGSLDKVGASAARTCWTTIVQEVKVIQAQGINIHDFIKLKLGNGEDSRFWLDKWYEGGVLKRLFPRVYALELDKNISVSSKLKAPSLVTTFRRNARSGIEQTQFDSMAEIMKTISLVPRVDRYIWSLENDGSFSVASIRKTLDDNRFQEESLSTRWVKSVPIKVNILAWKVKSNALPTRFNISRRGMDIDSIDCPICKMGVETTSHVFFQCNVVRQVMRKISSWWNVEYMEVNSYEEWRSWLVSTRIRSNIKVIIEGIYYGLWWVMWNFRNKILFDTKIPEKARRLLLDSAIHEEWTRLKVWRCSKISAAELVYGVTALLKSSIDSNDSCHPKHIWEALGGNTRDLNSIWKETRQDYNFTRSGFKNVRIVPGDGVAIPSDAVRTYKRWCQKLCDGMAVAAQNTNNTTIRSILLTEKLNGSKFTNWYRNLRIVLRYEKKIKFVEQPTGPAPDPETDDPDTINKTLEKYNAYDMLKELKTMFEEQAKQELFETVKAFHACNQEEGQSFIQNYNMHSMGKTIAELHAMLKLHEKDTPKKAKTPAVLAIWEIKIQKDKKKPRWAKGKDKAKNKLAYAPKPKIPPAPKRDNLAKDSVCYHYKEGLRESRKLKHGALIPRDDIYEIDMHNPYPNVSFMLNVSNKRAKYALDSSYLWHCRLGHINKKCIDKLQCDGILQPTHDESLEKCKSCISGKIGHKPFPYQVERVKDLLGLIHTDVCGPFRTVSREGASYFITFTDDFSRYGYVYLMKHKDVVFETFKFVNHMKSCGIVSQLTPPYTPQHNRVSERRSQTLLAMDRSMMNLKTLPRSFWGYALESANRILNIVPTKKVDRMPYEIWHKKASKLSYLRVFGCEALVKREAPDKLNPRSIKCIFVGFPKEMMGYYFYYPLDNKIFVAQKTKFFENSLMV
ncbi:retrotransposon protein, putative, ty1-copia subclass [Tanacetum coccineum]